MPATLAMSPTRSRTGHPRAQDIDCHIGARLYERRIILGLTQQQVAKMIGITYQQVHKYETGINRISAGRLFQIAQALGVEPGFFFQGLTPGQSSQPVAQRAMLGLARDFARLPSRQHQEALCHLARALAAGEPPGDLDSDGADERTAA